MSIKLERVKKGYIELGIEDRKALRNFIEEYYDATLDERSEKRSSINEQLRALGPTSSDNCPCCGN